MEEAFRMGWGRSRYRRGGPALMQEGVENDGGLRFAGPHVEEEWEVRGGCGNKCEERYAWITHAHIYRSKGVYQKRKRVAGEPREQRGNKCSASHWKQERIRQSTEQRGVDG